MVGKKVSNWECLFVHREKGLFLSVYVDDINLAGKKNIDPMWTVLNREVDLGEPTSFLDHRTMFASRIFSERTEKYHVRTIFVSLHGLTI